MACRKEGGEQLKKGLSRIALLFSGALAVLGLGGGVAQASLQPVQPAKTMEVREEKPLYLEHAMTKITDSGIQLAGHSSHVSHESHVSHRSHYSSR